MECDPVYAFLLRTFVKLHHQNYQSCYTISRRLITLIMAMTVLICLVAVQTCWIEFPHIFAVKDFGLHAAASLEILILPPELQLLQYANTNSPFSWPKRIFSLDFMHQCGVGPNVMAYRHMVMISLKSSWKRTGCYIRLSFNVLLEQHTVGGTPQGLVTQFLRYSSC